MLKLKLFDNINRLGLFELVSSQIPLRYFLGSIFGS